MHLPGLEIAGSNTKESYAVQMEDVAVEPGTNVDDDAGFERNGSLGSKVVLPLSKRKPPGMASIDPRAISNG